MRSLFAAAAILLSTSTWAATSPGAAPSPLGGNGHNVTFDGRVFVVAGGDGWSMRVLRPQNDVDTGAFVDVGNAFSPPALIQPTESGENAVALCEEDAADVPYACNDAGDRDGAGAFACYDLVVFDSNACGGGAPNDLRFRRLHLVVEHPGTPEAAYRSHQWIGERTPLRTSTNALMKGIEPTVTRDGKLLVWQGHPNNDGEIDVLMYATNAAACGTTGWSAPRVITHMAHDPAVVGRYRLAERVLRAADGAPFGDDEILRGGYPWLFPDGEAVNFTATTVPCRGENDPSGCGPRRGAWSILGYPTNWGVAHVDGAVNPDTDQTVRLFFTSPGPLTFSELPHSAGVDVWPFFGSNTSNYTEVVFDDGLDGNYAGVWLMNESVDKNGDLDRARTPDTSGYFNTGLVEGAVFPLRNDGPDGKALTFDGRGARVRVPADVSLDAANAITVEAKINPSADVDCDGNNNWRVLLQKGPIGQGAFSLVFEEGNGFQARVKAGGEQRGVFFNASIPSNQWSTVAFSYQASTGTLSTYINGQQTNAQTFAPALLDASDDDLLIGSPGFDVAACPDGNGGFFGRIEEVRVSRVDRFHDDVEGEGEGEGEGDVVVGEGEGEIAGGEGEGEDDGDGVGEGEGDGDDDGGDEPLLPPLTGDDDDGAGAGAGAADDGCAATPAGSLLALLLLLRRRR
jgi:hypothetical protein